MLELRPSCEHCNKPLPPASTEAMICSFECTFCKDCVVEILENVCRNCGGGFSPRPIRPSQNLKNESYLGKYPATIAIKYKPVDAQEQKIFSNSIKGIPPDKR